jgi:peptidoglycan/LPS O-acetylase OafA/YrhL
VKESSNLDVLRAFAVLLVLLDHVLRFRGVAFLGHLHTYGVLGRAGVWFFFVHTCLVLMMSMERQQARAPQANLFGSFYVRRLFRIYPLSVIFVLGVVLTKMPAGIVSPSHVQQVVPTIGDGISNLFLVQNLTRAQDILAVLWSLPLEVQMYLLLPPLFLLVTRWKSPWIIAGLWGAVVGALDVFRPDVTGPLSLAKYIPCFLPGVIAYALLQRTRPRIPSWLWLIWLAALVLADLRLGGGDHVNWLVCLALGLSIPLFKPISFRPLTRLGSWIARYSYGEYLCHVMCIWFAFEYLRGSPVAEQWSIFILLIIVIPMVLFHAVEAPMIRLGAHLADRWFAPRREVYSAAVLEAVGEGAKT